MTLKEILRKRKDNTAEVQADTEVAEQEPAPIILTFPQSDFYALFDGIEDF